MMKDMLKPEYIFLDVEVPKETKEDALKTISEICAKKKGFDPNELIQTFMARESADSTGFGSGVAIPHAKIKNLQEPMVAIFKFTKAIEWEAIDDEPVNLAIALIMPLEDEDNTHLQVISQFARLLVHDEFVEKLTNSIDSDDLYNYIIKKLEEKA